MADYSRVLRGAKLVVDQVIKKSRPEVQWRVERATYHLSELIKLAQDASSDFTSRKSSTTTTNAEDEGKEKASRTGMNEERDPIGFDQVTEVDQAHNAKVNAQENERDSVAKLMRERAVPATPFSRMMGFGGLAVRLAIGEAVGRASHVLSGSEQPHSLSDESAERLAESLCRMRGAALKLGQMLSIQDENSLPPALAKALDRVKQAADYMPQRQLEAQLVSQLGSDWRSHFTEFNPVPIAAASIGQVHRAVLKDGTAVALKIQYPGVAESIESDLDNLKRLVKVTGLLPPGLFIDNIISVARSELGEECDYVQEAASQMKYRELVLNDPILRKHTQVPEIFPAFSTSRILTSRLVPGVSIDKAANYSQPVRNAIARTVLLMTIRELFNWRFIQSDPNFANFLYDDPSRTIYLIDFGAARSYSKTFVDGYMRLVWAAANRDRDTILKISQELGFLTGDESQEFVDAHVEAGLVVGEPFLKNEPFDFANSQMSSRISQYGGTFMKYRLTPPPTEAYSLHRKLAGAFLLCIKLKANITCRDMLEDVFRNYKFD
eukprot:gene7472-8262_t